MPRKDGYFYPGAGWIPHHGAKEGYFVPGAGYVTPNEKQSIPEGRFSAQNALRSLIKPKDLVPVQRWVRHAPLTDGGVFPARFQTHLFRADGLKDAVIEVDVREPHPGFPPEDRLTRSVVILHRAADLSHLAPLTQDPEATFEIDFVAFPGVEPGQHVRVAIWMSDGPLTGSNQPLPFMSVRCVSFS